MNAMNSLWDTLESSLTPALRGFRSRVNELKVREKDDRSLLSEADVAIEALITSTIRSFDPSARIVAEEGTDYEGGSFDQSRSIWIIDPIDGTAEFVNPAGREFCTVVCALDPDQRPIGAFVFAPEIGPGRSPICIRLYSPGGPIFVNGTPTGRGETSAVSATRSRGTTPRPFEEGLAAEGFQVKTRTTSQTLDMVRLSVDLQRFTEPKLVPFSLFYRERQKVWDGAAGIGLALASGLRVTDEDGRDRTTIDIDLGSREPTFASTLAGTSTMVSKVLNLMSGAQSSDESLQELS